MHSHVEVLVPLDELSHTELEERLMRADPDAEWELGGRFRGAHGADGIDPEAGVETRDLGGLIVRCNVDASNIDAFGRFRLARPEDLLRISDPVAQDFLATGPEPDQWLLFDADLGEFKRSDRSSVRALTDHELALATIDLG